MWPGFDSRSRRRMWVEFVVGSLLAPRGFSPGSPVFPSAQKPTHVERPPVALLGCTVDKRTIIKLLLLYYWGFIYNCFIWIRFMVDIRQTLAEMVMSVH